jgi:ABC-type antimicrobial peptide transport system permease subunit
VPYNAIASTQKNKNGELVKKISISSKNWTEVTDQFYETKEGQALETLTQVYERFIKHSFPVIPTNKTGLLMDFHQGNVSISQGRDITQEEYSRGEKVCIVPQGFAGRNELKVGDKINLQLYFADYNRSASLTYYPSGGINLLFTLLNAKGEAYPVFEDSNYEIVGIYSGTNQNNNPTGYEMGYNAVVIPSESVKNSDENNIADFGPMKGYTTSFQIPNGTTKEYMEKFQALGIDNLEISFYDGGYEKLASGMENLKMVALILVAVSGVTTLAILFFFIYLFITKQKKRTAIERSLGMSKKECILSMLYGILGVISLGAMAGSFLGFKITGVVMADSVGGEELYSTAFSNWVNNSDKMAKLSTSGTWNNPIIPILLSLIVILVAIFISFLFIKNNLRAEPLGLLSKGEE